MENRGPSYPSECHPLDIGDPYEIEKAHSSMSREERLNNPLRKGELLKKIIKRQMAEYEVGIFTIDPKHFQNSQEKFSKLVKLIFSHSFIAKSEIFLYSSSGSSGNLCF